MSLFTVTFESSDEDAPHTNRKKVRVKKSVLNARRQARAAEHAQTETMPVDTAPKKPATPTKVTINFSSDFSDNSSNSSESNEEKIHNNSESDPATTPTETEEIAAKPPSDQVELFNSTEPPYIPEQQHTEKFLTNFVGVTDDALIQRLNGTIERLSSHTKPSHLIPYQLIRKKQIKINGKSVRMTLVRDSEELLYTKAESHSSSIRIYRADVRGQKNKPNPEAVLLSSKGFESFSLRLSDKFGPELMTIKYHHPKSEFAPRIVTVFFFAAPDDVERELSSKKPKITLAQTWILDMKGRIAKRSIKNCILIDSKKREVMSIVKTNSKLMTIETVPSISELCVFALGVSSVMCPI